MSIETVWDGWPAWVKLIHSIVQYIGILMIFLPMFSNRISDVMYGFPSKEYILTCLLGSVVFSVIVGVGIYTTYFRTWTVCIMGRCF